MTYVEGRQSALNELVPTGCSEHHGALARAQQNLAVTTVLICITMIYVNIPSFLLAFLCIFTLLTLCSTHLINFPTEQLSYFPKPLNIIHIKSLYPYLETTILVLKRSRHQYLSPSFQ